MAKCYACKNYQSGYCKLTGTHSYTGDICNEFVNKEHAKMFNDSKSELRATKHTLWMTRAKYADLMSCKESFYEYIREHPCSKWNDVRRAYSYETSFTNWSRWFQYISRTCLQKAKEFE